ncbi:protein RETICULATA, chloroplastic-like [Phalaenopsis equestris]|uniref:protein RETICULATA, chloroplastic-like n=1 Tax=Phalaenopsis equestris TaxID=78828 RepID=UPI0009E30A48|nr:protein RETICULATA, chloroplastic-like [Phalaenopsis equestris]
MAFCCSYIRLRAQSPLFDFPVRASISECPGRAVLIEASRSGLQTRSSSHFSLVLKEEKNSPTCFVVGSNLFFEKKRRKLAARSELQPIASADSGDLRISIKEAEKDISLQKENGSLDLESSPKLDLGNGDGGHSSGNGKFPPGGGGDSNDHENNDDKEDEFGPVLKFEEVIKETESRHAVLPSDMFEAAKTVGIQKVILLRYLEMQASAWPLGMAIKSCSILRNRMLADPSFLFKIGTEIIIDSCCATFAEIQRRGKDFWAEFELYAADLLVGLVVNVALVSMLAPYARFGQTSSAKGFLGRMAHMYGALPSSVFEAERPGFRYSLKQRIGTYFYKGILYGSVGFACGIVGQGIANMIMTAKRSVKKSEDDIPVPPLIKSAALWGVFLAVSSNTRYQIVNGLERLVESSPVAKSVPLVAMAFTVGVRFANNVYGGMQFVDWARWSGVQ